MTRGFLLEEVYRLLDQVDEDYQDRKCSYTFRQDYEQTIKACMHRLERESPANWAAATEQELQQVNVPNIRQYAGSRQAYLDLLAYCARIDALPG